MTDERRGQLEAQSEAERLSGDYYDQQLARQDALAEQ